MNDTVHASADWIAGAEAITYQACAACSSLQYFRRSFCAGCGASELIERRASGEGIVYAATLVCRAATAEGREHLPYKIVLLDTIEGFRMMGHGNIDLEVGDRVIAHYRRFTGHLVPFFERKTT